MINDDALVNKEKGNVMNIIIVDDEKEMLERVSLICKKVCDSI